MEKLLERTHGEKGSRGWRYVVIYGKVLKNVTGRQEQDGSVILDQTGSIYYWEEHFNELLSYAVPPNTVYSQLHNSQAPGADSI